MNRGSLLAVLALAACARSTNIAQPQIAAPAVSAMNALSASERSQGWRLLFDGRTTNGWRGYRNAPIGAWMAMDGTLMKDKPTEDLVTTDQFGDFDLVFDWKLSKGGNSGVFYRATEEYNKVYWSATEYQLLDDANHPDGKKDPVKGYITSAGTNYGLYPVPEQLAKPADEWNTSRIVARGNHVEHWLNGKKAVEYDYGSPDWEAKVKASKFRDYPNYGRAKRGIIAIQGDHTGMLALRNIKIREIK
jgi:hypothetical protein